MSLIKTLQQGILEVNQAYIEHDNLTYSDYRGMVVQYLISRLLIELGEEGDFGLCQNPESTGYAGWISVGECSLLFTPTAAPILCGDERSRMEDGEDNLSPIGSI